MSARIFPISPIRRRLLALAPALAASRLWAGILDNAPQAGGEDHQFLPVGEAFRVRWAWSAEGVATGEFQIAPGYYLYRDRIKVQIKSPVGAQAAALELPPAELKEDPYAGRQLVYHHSFEARLPIRVTGANTAPQVAEIEVVWQGCAEAGLCYPPVRRTFTLGG